MKKTTIALAVLLSSAIAIPAHANDAVRLGVGILGLVINEASKGGNRSSGKRHKGDQLIGRVGEEPTRNNRARNQNKVAKGAAAVAGGTAVAAFALPEGDKAPIPEVKPTAEQMTEYAANIASSSTPKNEVDEGVPLYDEQGRFWGSVTPADAQKVEQAVALGMKPSTVIPDMLGLKLPEAEPQSMEVPLIASTETKPQKAAEFTADLDAAVAADGGQLQKTAEIAAPEKEEEAAEVIPAVPSQATTAETKDTPPVVDVTETTASVESEPKVDLEAAKPVEVKKPKAKLDL